MANKSFRIAKEPESAAKRKAHRKELLDGGMSPEDADRLADTDRQVLAEVYEGNELIDSAYFPSEAVAEGWVRDVYKLL